MIRFLPHEAKVKILWGLLIIFLLVLAIVFNHFIVVQKKDSEEKRIKEALELVRTKSQLLKE